MSRSGRTPLRAHVRDHWERLNGAPRVAGVDFARGVAVVGMLAAHLLTTDERIVWSAPSTWDGIVHGNPSILFATLAGVSIGLYTGGRTPVTGAARGILQGRLLVRAVALWVLGVMLTLTGVPVFVILPAYAIMFALAVPLVGLSAPVLFAVAAGVALVMPFVHAAVARLSVWGERTGMEVAALIGWHYPFEVWFAFVLAGLGLARAGITRAGTLASALLAGAVLAVSAFALDAAIGAQARDDGGATLSERVWTAAPHSSGLLEVIGSGGLAIAVIAACVLLCRPWGRGGAGTGPVGWVVLPVRAVGAMPLTAYTAQIAVWAVLAAVMLGGTGDLEAFRALDPFAPITVAIVAGCTFWALVLGRGPLERVTDALARRLVPPR